MTTHTIAIDDAAAERLAAIANDRGVTVDDVIQDLINRTFGHSPASDTSGDQSKTEEERLAERRKKYAFVGMGASGYTDTARRFDEILWGRLGNNEKASGTEAAQPVEHRFAFMAIADSGYSDTSERVDEVLLEILQKQWPKPDL